MNRTVILACSATKRHDTAELSALARYDGPAWRTLRAYLTCMIEPPLALSAEHGLISAYQEIPDYDRQLDVERVRELYDEVAVQIAEFSRQGRIRGEIFLFGGPLYRRLFCGAIAAAEDELDQELGPVIYSNGGIGDQLGQLKAFLTRTPAPAIAPDDLEDEIELAAAAGAPDGYMARRCLICAALNPCREHSAANQHAELERNDREIAKLREEASR